jgi:hypothetical protein
MIGVGIAAACNLLDEMAPDRCHAVGVSLLGLGVHPRPCVGCGRIGAVAGNPCRRVEWLSEVPDRLRQLGIGAGRAPRLRGGRLSAADSATGSGTQENDLQEPALAKAGDPTLLANLEALVEPTTRGDPESRLRWTCKSVRRLAQALQAQGHEVSRTLVARLLNEAGYSLQGNRAQALGRAALSLPLLRAQPGVLPRREKDVGRPPTRNDARARYAQGAAQPSGIPRVTCVFDPAIRIAAAHPIGHLPDVESIPAGTRENRSDNDIHLT